MQSAKQTSQGATPNVRKAPPSSRSNKALDKHELAFLPAALEIVETPPSPVGRTIVFSIIALFCLALVWAFFGQVDIVASATGKIIPTGHTKVIQPFETGVVRAIHVRDGQAVREGEVLIELDPTMNQAETSHLESDLIAAGLDVARLRAALSDGDVLANFQPPEGAPAALVATQRKFLADQAAEQQAKLAVLDRQRAQKEAERATIAATVDKLEASLSVLQERVEMRKTLYDHATGSKASYLELLHPFVEEQQELKVQKSKISEAAGTVQQLSVHTVGGVVTPAQALLVVVPADSHLEIEAMVLNRDIGFIRAGQDAQIKIDTFNFSRYGLLHGKVLSVSPDAITHDKPQDKNGNDEAGDAENATSEPKGHELVYAARVSLDHEQMQVDDRLINLSPGMAVTVEIQTGTRRIISYLLSPLARYTHDSLRER
jgi:hemolysin D